MAKSCNLNIVILLADCRLQIPICNLQNHSYRATISNQSETYNGRLHSREVDLKRQVIENVRASALGAKVFLSRVGPVFTPSCQSECATLKSHHEGCDCGGTVLKQHIYHLFHGIEATIASSL